MYSIDNKYKVQQIKNFPINSLFLDSKKKNDSMNFEKFKIFSSKNTEKMFISSEKFMAVWYQNDIKKNISQGVEEISGTFYHMSLENEKQVIFGTNQTNITALECLTGGFGNNYFLGSFGRILYFILLPNDLSKKVLNNSTNMKIYLVDYLFKFNNSNKAKINEDEKKTNEYVKQIEKKIIYSFLEYPYEELKESIYF